MANIPPQENWFAIAEKEAPAVSVGAVMGTLTYTCPRNRCAVITGWTWEEIVDGSQIAIYFSGDGATGTPRVAIMCAVAENDLDPTDGGVIHRWLDIRLGPGDNVSVRPTSIMGGTPTYDVAFFVREIGPASNNMGTWTE